MTDDSLENRIHLELESLQYNELHELGNRAQAAGLIMGHGHRQGKYEICAKAKPS